MKAIDVIRWAMQLTEGGTARLVADMTDAAMTRSTPTGNPVVWLVGHLCIVEGNMPRILLGRPNPVEHWTPLFGMGTQPKSDAGAYPPFEEVLSKYRELRAANLKMLDEIGDAGLDRKPAWVPPGFEDIMTTAGHTLALLSLHNMVHYGQIADARRMAGRKPLM
jgi:hypothetical protein